MTHIAAYLGAKRVSPAFKYIPQAQGLVPTAGDDAFTVRAEGDAGNEILLSLLNKPPKNPVP